MEILRGRAAECGQDPISPEGVRENRGREEYLDRLPYCPAHTPASAIYVARKMLIRPVGDVADGPNDDDVAQFFLRRMQGAAAPFGISVSCDESGTITGWQALLPFDHNPAINRYVAEWRIYVAPEHRGIGYGEALTRWAMQVTSDSAMQYIIGFISSENKSALDLVHR